MKIELGEEQKQALDKIFEFIKSKEHTFSLTGSAGTGKSLLITKIIEFLERENIEYCLCAPTHKAKTVLEYYTKRPSVTLHKLLSLSPKLDIINLDFRDLTFKMGAIKEIPTKGIIICDESSMISDDLFKLLLKVSEKVNTKIIFIGDKCQLKPVDSNRVSLVYKIKNSYNLTKIYRQQSKNSILPILENLREQIITDFTNYSGEDKNLLCTSDFKKFYDWCKIGVEDLINKSDIFQTKVLAFTNARVNNYNTYLTQSIFGSPKKYYKSEILTGYENLTFNNYDFFNSMDYIIIDNPKEIDIKIPNFLSLPGYELLLYDTGNNITANIKILSKYIDESYFIDLAGYIEETRIEAVNAKYKSRSLAWKKYYQIYNSFTSPKDLFYDNRLIRRKSFDRGYSTTVHKSQGSNYNNVYVDMYDINTCTDKEQLRQLQYVALSRTRGNVYIFQK